MITFSYVCELHERKLLILKIKITMCEIYNIITKKTQFCLLRVAFIVLM